MIRNFKKIFKRVEVINLSLLNFEKNDFECDIFIELFEQREKISVGKFELLKGSQ